MSDGTPAARARARRDPAVGLPPLAPKTQRDLANLHIRVAGVPYLIGPRLKKSGCELELTMDGASALRLSVDDPDGALLEVLADEAMRLKDGVLVIVDDVTYVLRSVSVPGDGTTVDLTFEDQVAWRLRMFKKYVSKPRSKWTRAEFVKYLVDEASRAPMAGMDAYIPELTDRQPVARG